jgi:hypothetical protein
MCSAKSAVLKEINDVADQNPKPPSDARLAAAASTSGRILVEAIQG